MNYLLKLVRHISLTLKKSGKTYKTDPKNKLLYLCIHPPIYPSFLSPIYLYILAFTHSSINSFFLCVHSFIPRCIPPFIHPQSSIPPPPVFYSSSNIYPFIPHIHSNTFDRLENVSADGYHFLYSAILLAWSSSSVFFLWVGVVNF